MSAPPLFRLENLAVSQAGRVVLDLARLELPDGVVTAVLGPNGAGKTTLLNVLAQLLAPDRGRLSFLGQEVGRELEPAQVRRRVTMVHQEPYLFQGSVEANLVYALRLRGWSRTRQAAAVERVLDLVGLAGFARRRARALSAGERQRVALARALALEPRAILLDEPFANLDETGAAICEELVAGLPAAGCAVVLVTHALDQAQRLAGQIARLQAGRLATAE